MIGTFQNAVTGETIVPELVTNVHLINDTDVGIVFDVNANVSSVQHVLGPGPVVLSSDLIIKPNEELLVKPGTTILLDEGVSIFSKGRVKFDGNSNDNIVVKRLNKDKPWGVVAVHGKMSNGSLISNAIFSGGSTAF